MELAYVKPRVTRLAVAGMRSMRYVFVPPFAYITRGKQTRNYLKRARPGIQIYSFARIIPDEALKANSSMSWRTLVVLLESLFNPRCLLQGTRYRACARQGSPKIQIRLNRPQTRLSFCNEWYGFRSTEIVYGILEFLCCVIREIDLIWSDQITAD